MLVKITTNVLHNGHSFTKGEVVDISPDIASSLSPEFYEETEVRKVTTSPENEPVEAPKTDDSESTDESTKPDKMWLWGKARLVEYARANGIEIDETSTQKEIYAIIKNS